MQNHTVTVDYHQVGPIPVTVADVAVFLLEQINLVLGTQHVATD